jgi:hypothetical protein
MSLFRQGDTQSANLYRSKIRYCQYDEHRDLLPGCGHAVLQRHANHDVLARGRDSHGQRDEHEVGDRRRRNVLLDANIWCMGILSLASLVTTDFELGAASPDRAARRPE